MKLTKLLLVLTALGLSACGSTPASSSQSSSSESAPDTSKIKIIAPSGAPTLAFYNKIDQLTTSSATATVRSQLQTNDYDVVVFDFKTGLDDIKNSNGTSNYKLARILTAGNLVLVGINNKEEPKEGDKIVSFGKNLLPDLAFNELYGNSGAEVSYVDGGVQNVAPVLKSKKYQGEPVDYVVIAEPLLTSTLAGVEDPENYTQFSIREKWEEVKGNGHIIPQAGLFINMNSYQNNEKVYNEFLKELDSDISNGLTDPTLIKTAFESVGDVEAQKEKFGIPANMAFKVTKTNNGCGLVSEYNKLALTNFFADINQSFESYKDYVL